MVFAEMFAEIDSVELDKPLLSRHPNVHMQG